MARENKKYVGISLTDEEFTALGELAMREHRSKSGMIRVALIEFLAQKKQKKAS